MGMGVIVFDWSGTLCDNREQFYRVYQQMFKACGKPVPTNDWIHQHYVSPYMNFWNAHVPELTHEKESQLYEQFMAAESPAGPYPGAAATLERLQQSGHAMHVVSADPHKTLRADIERLGFQRFFKTFVGSVHDKTMTLQHIRSKYEHAICCVAYIGDTAGDVVSSKRAGMTAIAVTTGVQSRETLEQSNPDMIINSIDELVRIFG